MIRTNKKNIEYSPDLSGHNSAFTLNGLLDEVKGAYWQWDLEEKTISWSPQAADLLGIKRPLEKQPQSRFLSIVYLKTLSQLKAAVENAPLSQQIKKIEISVADKHGKSRWYQMIIFPGYSRPEPPHIVVGVVLDINSSKKMEEDLNIKNNLLVVAGQIAKFGAWEVNIAKRTVNWSDQAYKIHGVPQGFKPTLDNVFDFYLEESRAILERSFNALIEHGIPYEHELQLRTYQGKTIWVRVRSSPVFFNNELLKIRGFIQDITREKKYKEQLEAQERLLDGAFRFATIGKALIKNGEVQINEKLQEMLGYEESFYQNLDWNDITVPEDRPRERAMLEAYQRGSSDQYCLEKRLIPKDGLAIWTSFHRSVIRDDNGLALYELLQIQNIDRQKKLEMEKEREINLLSMRNEQLNIFAHIVSHNLRSHSGNLEALCDLHELEESEDEKKHLFDNINRVSEGLSNTIGHLSEMVKTMQDANRQLQRTPFHEVLESTLQVLHHQIQESGARIESDFSLCPEIEYSPAYLDSIFLNLISNGIKYRSPKRTAHLIVKAYTKNGHVHLCFQDNGMGLDLKTYGEKLFGLYKTFHGNANAQGVGLFLTRNQVESMGGKIFVDSQLDKGTTFTVRF